MALYSLATKKQGRQNIGKKQSVYFRTELRKDLRKPLRTIASNHDLEMRQLLSQIVETFVNGRKKIFEALEPNAESQQ